MNTLIQADIFFFVTTIAVILIALLFLVAVFYIILILRDIRKVSKVFRKSGQVFAEEIVNAKWIRTILLLILEMFKKPKTYGDTRKPGKQEE